LHEWLCATARMHRKAPDACPQQMGHCHAGQGFGAQLMDATHGAFANVFWEDHLGLSGDGGFARANMSLMTVHGAMGSKRGCASGRLDCWFVPMTCSARTHARRNATKLDQLSRRIYAASKWSLAMAIASLWWPPNAHVLRAIGLLDAAVRRLANAMGAIHVAAGVHLRGGDKLNASGKEKLCIWSSAQVARVIRGATRCGSRPQFVLALAQERTSVARLRRELAPACSGRLGVVSLEEARPPRMELSTYLVASLWLIAGAPLVLANSRSNLGSVAFTLAGARRGSRPARVVDMDHEWTSDDMRSGLFPCSWAFGPREGLCASWSRDARRFRTRGVSGRAALREAGGRPRFRGRSRERGRGHGRGHGRSGARGVHSGGPRCPQRWTRAQRWARAQQRTRA